MIGQTPYETIVYDFPVILGRDPACQAVISAPSVSRRHARIIWENGSYFLEDLGSSNGSAVNGVRVGDGAAQLEPGGCAVELGQVTVAIDFALQGDAR
jgi:pSer/pThr/pTyr-binding forkhead associated (FHA) protein